MTNTGSGDDRADGPPTPPGSGGPSDAEWRDWFAQEVMTHESWPTVESALHTAIWEDTDAHLIVARITTGMGDVLPDEDWFGHLSNEFRESFVQYWSGHLDGRFSQESVLNWIERWSGGARLEPAATEDSGLAEADPLDHTADAVVEAGKFDPAAPTINVTLPDDRHPRSPAGGTAGAGHRRWIWGPRRGRGRGRGGRGDPRIGRGDDDPPATVGDTAGTAGAAAGTGAAATGTGATSGGASNVDGDGCGATAPASWSWS